jgi:hypothetical protein
MVACVVRNGQPVAKLKRQLRGWVSALVVATCAASCDGPAPAPTGGPTPPEEAQRIARSLTRVVGPPAGGYPLVRTTTGAQMLQLRGRLQQVVVAGRGPDGSLRTSCVSSPAEAEQFLAPTAR